MPNRQSLEDDRSLTVVGSLFRWFAIVLHSTMCCVGPSLPLPSVLIAPQTHPFGSNISENPRFTELLPTKQFCSLLSTKLRCCNTTLKCCLFLYLSLARNLLVCVQASKPHRFKLP